jgi:hypothetical protein
MRINFLYKGVLAAAALGVAVAALPASATGSGPGAGAASQGAFAVEASNLLQQVKIEAIGVGKNVDRLRVRLRDSFENDSQSDADLLGRVQDRVNEMDKLLYRLRANESEALPWQQQAIDRIAPTVVNLTDTTEDAIATLNNNRGRIQFSNLDGLAGDMYNQARLIDRAIGNFEKYASARHEAQQLRQTLGL